MIHYQGFSEREVLQFLEKFLQLNMIVMDVGAHIKEFTLIAAKLVGALGKVYAFEPDPRNCALLRQNVKPNGINHIIELSRHTLSDTRAGSETLAQALAGLAIALSFLLLLWLVHWSCYVKMHPRWTVAASGLNLIFTVVGFFLLWRAGLLFAFSALLLLGAPTGISSLMPMVPHSARDYWAFLATRHCAWCSRITVGYGRWAIAESIVYFVPNYALVLLSPILLGLAESGAFAALMNFYRAINLLVQSATLVLLPTYSVWWARGMLPLDL